MLAEVQFYDVVVALHVLAIVAAFGVAFAYPVLVPYVMRQHPDAAPALFGGMVQLNRLLTTPAGAIALLAGIYLASDRDYWSETWVTVPLVILVVLMGLVGAVFTPQERRLAKLTADELGAGTAPARWSPEVDALMKREAGAGTAAAVLVAVAVFFMVAKPFA